MSYTTQPKKILAFMIFLLLFFLSAALPGQAAEPVKLKAMEKQENLGTTRITLSFSRLPEYQIEHSGQRIDLLLKDVQAVDNLAKLPEDETVVKILLGQKYQDLLASFLLRRVPQDVVTETKENPARIVVDLYWDGDPDARPGVAFRVSGLPGRKPGKAAQDYQLRSAWEGHWRDFFSQYRSDWKLRLPQHFSLPVLPVLVTDEQSPLWPLQQFAAEGKWLSLLSKAPQITGLSPEQMDTRELLIAEAQLRTQAYAAGLQRLDRLKDSLSAPQPRVGYLTAFGQAASGQPFVAQLTLLEFLPNLPKNEPLQLLSTLLAAETSLASNRPGEALKYLQNEGLHWPLALQPVVDLRRADALAGQGKPKQALALYRQLTDEPGLFEQYPASLNQAAFSAYQAADFTFSNQLYHRLAEVVPEQPGADLIQYAIGATAYAAGDVEWGLIGLQKAQLDWPRKEGGERAALRLLDNQVITGGEIALAKTAPEYGRISQQASSRVVREEGLFKQALALYLLTDYQKSVDLFMRFRRDFHSSKLRSDAEVLLRKQIPLLVHRLLEEQNELDAVVLVEQNRKLLLSGQLNRPFLNDVAEAFDNLGLYDRAGKVLLYMFDRSGTEEQRKPLYLPLAESFLKRGEYRNASDYADRYLQKYPHGEDSGALFGVLLDAFAEQDRNDELLAWLDRPDRPSSPELEIRAAWLYWKLGRPDRVIDSLEKVRQLGAKLKVKEMALLAECDYLQGKNNAAEKNYQLLSNDPAYGTQARYRLAQLLLRKQQRQAALKLLQQIVEEDENSSWGKLARDLLIQVQK